MVAITVILAAVIAAFVLDLGDTDEAAPTVAFDYDYDQSEKNLTVIHESGDNFDPGEVSLAGVNLEADDGEDGVVEGNFPESDGDYDGESLGGLIDNEIKSFDDLDEDEIGAGDRFTLFLDDDNGNGNEPDAYELDIVFEGPDGDSSDIIGSDTGPDA